MLNLADKKLNYLVAAFYFFIFIFFFHVQAGASDAARNYCALLAEAVRALSSEWSDTWEILQRDPQGRATNPLLGTDTAERLFREHIQKLSEAASRSFIELLQEHKTQLSSLEQEWSVVESDVEAILGNEIRYQRLPPAQRAGAWQHFKRQGQGHSIEEKDKEVAVDPAYARLFLEKDIKRPRID